MKTEISEVFGKIKAVLLFIANILPVISWVLGGITLAGVMAILGNFIGLFSNLIKIKIPIPLPLLVAVCPLLIYAVIMPVIKLIDIIRKPRYLSFNTMDFMEWRLKWIYEPDKDYDHYLIKDIHAICPVCGCRLVEIEYPHAVHETELYCPICRAEPVKKFVFDRDAKVIIEHRIENKLF